MVAGWFFVDIGKFERYSCNLVEFSGADEYCVIVVRRINGDGAGDAVLEFRPGQYNAIGFLFNGFHG